MAGYHIADIPEGDIGEFSKIEEEFEECKDAFNQDNSIMLLLELSDLIGAIELYLEHQHPSISLSDLLFMKDTTHRAFKSNYRKSKTAKSST